MISTRHPDYQVGLSHPLGIFFSSETSFPNYRNPDLIPHDSGIAGVTELIHGKHYATACRLPPGALQVEPGTRSRC